jgi:hypothetical protein
MAKEHCAAEFEFAAIIIELLCQQYITPIIWM